MAKQRTEGAARRSFVKLCSYVALFLAALMYLLGGVLSKVFSAQVVGIFNLIGQLSMLIGIAFPAYEYSRGLHKAWRIIYWIALVVYLFGCIFGVIMSFK